MCSTSSNTGTPYISSVHLYYVLTYVGHACIYLSPIATIINGMLTSWKPLFMCTVQVKIKVPVVLAYEACLYVDAITKCRRVNYP